MRVPHIATVLLILGLLSGVFLHEISETLDDQVRYTYLGTAATPACRDTERLSHGFPDTLYIDQENGVAAPIVGIALQWTTQEVLFQTDSGPRFIGRTHVYRARPDTAWHLAARALDWICANNPSRFREWQNTLRPGTQLKLGFDFLIDGDPGHYLIAESTDIPDNYAFFKLSNDHPLDQVRSQAYADLAQANSWQRNPSEIEIVLGAVPGTADLLKRMTLFGPDVSRGMYVILFIALVLYAIWSAHERLVIRRAERVLSHLKLVSELETTIPVHQREAILNSLWSDPRAQQTYSAAKEKLIDVRLPLWWLLGRHAVWRWSTEQLSSWTGHWRNRLRGRRNRTVLAAFSIGSATLLCLAAAGVLLASALWLGLLIRSPIPLRERFTYTLLVVTWTAAVWALSAFTLGLLQVAGGALRSNSPPSAALGSETSTAEDPNAEGNHCAESSPRTDHDP